ncbi:PTS glucitol/sorbitol transporter subunit IIA [Pseudogracilibacillus sp. SE30717A]|uniref:PTS glucitol/sorbitol transporter subunit IIA n=1 Tax=Pseudogracilibacillus sp. SE30717A TaxID=3098293 RepID=UPI00300E27E2
MIYESIVTKIGEDVEDFLEEKMVVLFNENVPEELTSIALVHEEKEMNGEVNAGDYFVLGDVKYKVLAVGNKANETLHELGHCTIKFSVPAEDDLPGTIVVEDKAIPELVAGLAIKFEKSAE